MLTYLFVLVLAFAQETPEDTNPLSQPMMLQTETTHPSLRTILNLMRNQKKDIEINENLHHGWARRTRKGYAKGLIRPRSQWGADVTSGNDNGDLIQKLIILIIKMIMGRHRSPPPRQQEKHRRKRAIMYVKPSPPSPPMYSPAPMYSYYEPSPPPPPAPMYSEPAPMYSEPTPMYFEAAEAPQNDYSWGYAGSEPSGYADYGHY